MSRPFARVAVVVSALSGVLLAATLALPLSLRTKAESIAWVSRSMPEMTDTRVVELEGHQLYVGNLARASPEPAPPVVAQRHRALDLGACEGCEVIAVRRAKDVVVLALQLMVEGPGPELKLLISTDNGATWHLRTLPKPSCLADLERVDVAWPAVEVDPEWRRWPLRVAERLTERPLLKTTGEWRAVSHDAAASFRLSGPWR